MRHTEGKPASRSAEALELLAQTAQPRLSSRAWRSTNRSAHGLCQREGGAIEVIRPGDRVLFEPGENHWHGAAPNRFKTHIAIQQNDDSGNPVTWGRHVSDEEYAAAPATGASPTGRGSDG